MRERRKDEPRGGGKVSQGMEETVRGSDGRGRGERERGEGS